jgi:hypothetical protein
MNPKETRKFRLYRLTKPMSNGCTHAGEVWIQSKLFVVYAKVEDTDFGRQFVGDVQPAAQAITSGNARTPPGSPSEPVPDHVSQAEGAPFNDDLPF